MQRRMIIDALAEIPAHFAKFRIIYCCVGNTAVISTSMIQIKTPRRENKFIKIVKYSKLDGYLILTTKID